MPTLYPAQLDTLTNPSPSTSQAANRSHSGQHADLNDAVEAIETALGITGSPNHPGQLRADLAATGAGKGGLLVRFIQNLAGAVARWITDKLYETVSVEDFGAIGDGVADDTAAIQLAINSNVARIRFTKDTYIVSASLTGRSNMALLGTGKTTIKLKSGLVVKPGTLLNLDPGPFQNVTLEGIVFDSNRANNIEHGAPDGAGNQPSSWVGSHIVQVQLSLVSNLRIRNCTFQNSWGYGLWVNDCTDFSVDNNVFADIRIAGCAARHLGVNPLVSMRGSISNNKFNRMVVGAMMIDGVQGVSVTGNIAENCNDSYRFPAIGYSGDYPNIWPSTGGFINSGAGGYISPAQVGDGSGIEITVSSNPINTSRDISITGNSCRTCYVGIRAEGQPKFCTIVGNTCSDNVGPGIFLYSVQSSTITGNTCNNNRTGIESQYSPAFGGPPAQQPLALTITGNTIRENTNQGILLGGNASCVVAGNVINGNCVAGGANDGGITLQLAEGSGCATCVFSDNVISGNWKNGIGFDGTTHTGNLIAGNNIQGNVLAAIQSPSAGYPWSTNKVAGNAGSMSTNYGAATLNSGGTSIVVNHGLPFTPDNGRISVTPASDTGGKRWWYDTVTSTQFTIRIDSVHGSNIVFAWSIEDDV